MRSHPTGPRRRLAVAGLVAALAGFEVPAVAAGARADDDLRRELDALAQERAALEPALLAAARLVPSEPETAALEARLRRFAEVAGVEIEFRALEAGGIPALPDGSPGPLRLDRVELSGHGELWRLGALLSHVEAGALRLLDLESLELATGDGPARFTARLICPTWTGAADAAGAPAGGVRSIVAERRAELERLRQRVAVLDDWVARTKDGRLAAAADLLEALGEVERTQLTALGLADRIELAGATLGAPAREALSAAIESAGFAVAAAATPAAGACRPFHFALAPPARSARWFSPAMIEVGPDPGASALCATEPAPAAGALRANGDATRAGAFTLRARGLELVDLFRLLHEMTGADFVVDSEIAGRVDVDFAGATLDEAQAEAGRLGLEVGPEPIRRVSRRATESRSDDWTGEPVSLAFARLDVVEMLCLFDRAFGLPSRVEPGLDAEVSIFVDEQPWDRALVRALESAGLAYEIADGIAYVAPAARLAARAGSAWVPTCEVDSERTPGFSKSLVELADLDASDLTLAAFTGAAGSALGAWVYGAFGRIYPLGVGSQLAGATVEAIDESAVTLSLAAGGRRKLTFPD